jgi:GAF domain-containing protein
MTTPDETDNPEEISTILARMGGVLLTEDTLDAVLDLISSLARSTIQGADAVSVTLVRDGKIITAAYTDDSVMQLDSVQYENHSGPCVSALDEGVVIDSKKLAEETRWPEFRVVARDNGIAAVRSSPLKVHDRAIGALNLYSRSSRGFDESHEIVELFGNQASIILANAEAYTSSELLNEQLREALRSREMIGQAKGILMEREGCSADEAFDVLRRASQNSNKKLRDIAKEVVSSAAREPR